MIFLESWFLWKLTAEFVLVRTLFSRCRFSELNTNIV